MVSASRDRSAMMARASHVPYNRPMAIGRRDVLRWSALGAGAATLEGCVRQTAPAVAPPLGEAELARTLEKLDLVVGTIQSSKPDPVRVVGKASDARVEYG